MTSDAPATNVFFGAGGHAAVLIDALKAADSLPPSVAVDADKRKWQTDVLDVPVIGNDDKLAELIVLGLSHFVVGIGSVGKTHAKRNLFELGQQRGLQALSVVHPTASISQFATIGTGLQLLAAAVIGTCAHVGDNVLINTGAIVEHDCTVEDHVHIATGARLAGGVYVETGAHVGIGAVVLQGVRIGAEAVVGAGAVVLQDVAAKSTVVGVPAKAI